MKIMDEKTVNGNSAGENEVIRGIERIVYTTSTLELGKRILAYVKENRQKAGLYDGNDVNKMFEMSRR